MSALITWLRRALAWIKDDPACQRLCYDLIRSHGNCSGTCWVIVEKVNRWWYCVDFHRFVMFDLFGPMRFVDGLDKLVKSRVLGIALTGELWDNGIRFAQAMERKKLGAYKWWSSLPEKIKSTERDEARAFLIKHKKNKEKTHPDMRRGTLKKACRDLMQIRSESVHGDHSSVGSANPTAASIAKRN